MRRLLLVLLLVFSFAAPVHAATLEYVISGQETGGVYSYKGLGYSDISGNFTMTFTTDTASIVAVSNGFTNKSSSPVTFSSGAFTASLLNQGVSMYAEQDAPYHYGLSVNIDGEEAIFSGSAFANYNLTELPLTSGSFDGFATILPSSGGSIQLTSVEISSIKAVDVSNMQTPLPDSLVLFLTALSMPLFLAWRRSKCVAVK